MNRTVKKIQCKVVQSAPLTYTSYELGQSKRANSQLTLGKTVRGQNAQTAHLNDKVKLDLDGSFGWQKFAVDAEKGQFFDFWA